MINLDFFKILYHFCETGNINIRPIPGTNSFIPTDDLESIETVCNQEGVNYYFGVALRNNDGTKKGITEIPAVWCDVDFKDTPREILIEKIKQFPFKPTITVKSGGGIHFYFVLKEPSNQHDIPIIEDVNKDDRYFRNIAEASNVTIKSLLGVPLVTKNKVIGALEAINKKNGGFTSEDQEILMTLGAQAAIAIENTADMIA